MKQQRKTVELCMIMFFSILFTLIPFWGYASDHSAADCGTDGCMVAGTDVVGYCKQGSCQILAVPGVTSHTFVDCGTDGCMVAGTDVVGYCSRGSCQALTVSGVMPGSSADCGADGCLAAGNGVVAYCSRGSCQILAVPGAISSPPRAFWPRP